jgi:hypothetical protein
MSDRDVGRPLERVYPPRIDASPEEIARAVLAAPPPPLQERTYTCAGCARAVAYPETLYRDDRCADCTAEGE